MKWMLCLVPLYKGENAGVGRGNEVSTPKPLTAPAKEGGQWRGGSRGKEHSPILLPTRKQAGEDKDVLWRGRGWGRQERGW